MRSIGSLVVYWVSKREHHIKQVLTSVVLVYERDLQDSTHRHHTLDLRQCRNGVHKILTPQAEEC